MTSSRELTPYNPDNQPLDEKLQAQFDVILCNTAEELEAFSQPDAITLETKGTVFGQFNQDSLAISHTVDEGEHLGSIVFTDSDDPAHSFSITLQRRVGRSGQLWLAKTGVKYTSWGILRKLKLNWPLTGRELPKEQDDNPLAELNEIMFTVHPDVSPQDIFELLDGYTDALRFEAVKREAETGEHVDNKVGGLTCKMQWHYHDIRADASDDSVYAKSTHFSLTNYEDNALRQIDTDIIIADYPINGTPTPLTCHIHRDVFGNVSMTADYVDLKVNERIALLNLSYIRILAKLAPALAEVVEEKTLVA